MPAAGPLFTRRCTGLKSRCWDAPYVRWINAQHRLFTAVRSTTQPLRNETEGEKWEVQMPTTRFTAETWPESATEFRRILQEAWQGSTPIDDFVQLVRELTLLEEKHGLDSADS